MYLLNFHIMINYYIFLFEKYYITHNFSCKTKRPEITDGEILENVNTKYKVSKSILEKKLEGGVLSPRLQAQRGLFHINIITKI